jgi:hypothetical protein
MRHRRQCLEIQQLSKTLMQEKGVHNVHTWGFGLGRTSAGLRRTGEVSGGVADLLGLEPGSSLPRARVFPGQGLVGP